MSCTSCARRREIVAAALASLAKGARIVITSRGVSTVMGKR